MTADRPAAEQIPQLRALWKEAFGDSEAYLDGFFRTAFHPSRCRCLAEQGEIYAALYWFDCICRGGKIAYLYAVATAERMRGRGLCRTLMADTHAHLQKRGYAGAVLVPGEASLFAFYHRMGYRAFGGIRTVVCDASPETAAVYPVGITEYAARRRMLLPEGGVVQEGENLDFLALQTELYAGDGFVLCAVREGDALYAPEFLGDAEQIPDIVGALGCRSGEFRLPGEERPFAMYYPLTDTAQPPAYFGLAFD